MAPGRTLASPASRRRAALHVSPVSLPLHATSCAVCGTFDNAEEVYPERLVEGIAMPEVYSARRLPDGLHHRIVRCLGCGLLRSDPRLDDSLVEQLYIRSAFTYAAQTAALRATYGRYLRRLERYGGVHGSLLEIGCGNAFLLLEARAQAYDTVRGVEPSVDAVAQAPPELRGDIVTDVMRPGLFAPGSFDVVCMFQVLDHLPDPVATLRECSRVLRPNGLVLSLNHDVGAFSARLMGERSPIVDVEHTYLFSKQTMRSLFEAAGFDVLEVGRVLNTYDVPYLVRLLPIPGSAKRAAVRFLEAVGGRSVHLRVPLGNLFLVGRRPAALDESGSR